MCRFRKIIQSNIFKGIYQIWNMVSHDRHYDEITICKRFWNCWFSKEKQKTLIHDCELLTSYLLLQPLNTNLRCTWLSLGFVTFSNLPVVSLVEGSREKSRAKKWRHGTDNSDRKPRKLFYRRVNLRFLIRFFVS